MNSKNGYTDYGKKFQIGDTVVKTYGKKPAKIIYAYRGYDYKGDYYNCKYLHSGGVFHAYGKELKIYEEDTEQMAQTNILLAIIVFLFD